MFISVFSFQASAKQDNGNKPHRPTAAFTARLTPKDTVKVDTTKPQTKLPPPKQDTAKN